MSRPWLSVIMPTYNGAPYLGSALESLVAQQERDFDVVVVDDGSTDATMEILREYATRLPVTIVEQEHVGNWVTNTNLGMRLATGAYFGWLHQDDTWHPDRLLHLKRLACEWPQASLLVHPSWFIDARGRRIGVWRCPLPRRTVCLESQDVLGRLLIQDFVASSVPIFTAEAASEAGGMDEGLWYVADWDFWLKLASLGETAHYPAPLASCRIHADSQTSTRTCATDEVERQYATVLARHLSPWERQAPNRRRVARVARFSAELNVALMRFAAGRKVGWASLLKDFLGLGPAGWRRFFRDSRILDRTTSRLRAGIVRGTSQKAGCPRASVGGISG